LAQRVLLTGITGYIGQQCGAELLRQGYEVIGTVRSPAKADDTKAAIAKVAPAEALTFAEADLLSDTVWDEAMQGCTFVVHAASPFVLAFQKDENQLIRPAVEGTQRVMAAAQRAGVKRLVLTSSTVAISAGKGSGRYGPDSWSNTEAQIGAYAKSKTLAERAAWETAATGDMELVVINPGAVAGPSLGAHEDSQSVTMVSDMIGGKVPMIPDFWRGWSMSAGYAKVPSRKAPTIALKAISLFDSEVKGMLPLLGTKAAFDNHATLKTLDWQPTAMQTSFTEMANALSA